MTKPTLNFVWIGAPKFDKGGQDVIGPESFEQNFKTFPSAGGKCNPMVFWCQAKYKDTYAAYFSSKGISIDVQAIEPYLHQRATDIILSPSEQDEATRVLQNYHDLMLAPDQGKTINCVFMKDMFFNYILATQGDYVLDTNLWASSDQAVDFPANPTFMFPIVYMKDNTQASEVWLQYAPPHSTRAQACLTCYLTLYDEIKMLSETTRFENIGRVAIDALYKRPHGRIPRNQSKDESFNVWEAEMISASDVDVPELCVVKEYANSHLKNRAWAYPPVHYHALCGEIEKLTFDLDHGLSPDTQANPKQSTEKGLGYDASNETLLHASMRYSYQEKNRRCAQLLLERGANPNTTHPIQFTKQPEREESALTYAIKSKDEKAIQLLFDYTTHPIKLDHILNELTPLMLAIKYKNGLELLLSQGANPNQTLPDKHMTALAMALSCQDQNAVDLLLRYGADPSAFIYITRGTEKVRQRMDEIETSEACRTRLHIAMEEKVRKRFLLHKRSYEPQDEPEDEPSNTQKRGKL